MNEVSKEIKSPCISVCVLNADDVCEGCYRTAAEITAWGSLNNEQKKQVIEAVKVRFTALNKHQLL